MPVVSHLSPIPLVSRRHLDPARVQNPLLPRHQTDPKASCNADLFVCRRPRTISFPACTHTHSCITFDLNSLPWISDSFVSRSFNSKTSFSFSFSSSVLILSSSPRTPGHYLVCSLFSDTVASNQTGPKSVSHNKPSHFSPHPPNFLHFSLDLRVDQYPTSQPSLHRLRSPLNPFLGFLVHYIAIAIAPVSVSFSITPQPLTPPRSTWPQG